MNDRAASVGRQAKEGVMRGRLLVRGPRADEDAKNGYRLFRVVDGKEDAIVADPASKDALPFLPLQCLHVSPGGDFLPSAKVFEQRASEWLLEGPEDPSRRQP